MLFLIGRRLLQLIPTLLFVSIIIFGLQRLLPGDPALAMAGEERDPAVLEQIRRQYRLDQPLPVQYVAWVAGVITGNLGESLRLKELVFVYRPKISDHHAARTDGNRHLTCHRRHRWRHLCRMAR